VLAAFEAFANPGGLFPEQVWDGPALPAAELFPGQPSGSAMPLAWAHAEYLKLVRSLEEGAVFDLPPQTASRYLAGSVPPAFHAWRFNQKCRAAPAGSILRIETLAPAVVHWTLDEWKAAHDSPTRDTGLGVFVAELPTKSLPPGRTVVFTFYWPEEDRWEGENFQVRFESAGAG